MPNAIKYTTGSESLSLKKGNFYIGTGDVSKGPTNSTGFYNGITPPSSGYTVYTFSNSLPGNISYFTAANDTQLINYTNNLSGTSYTSATQCLTYFASQTDKVVLNLDYGSIVTSGMVLSFDAGFTPSYPRSGTTLYDISGSNNGTLYNGPTFENNSILFDGSDDYGLANTNGAWNNSSLSITCVCYPTFDVSTFGRPMFTKAPDCAGGIEFALEYGRGNVSSQLPNKFSFLWGGNIMFESPLQYPKNNWYIVTVNVNSSNNTYSFYVNGVLSTSGSYSISYGTGNGNYGIGLYDGCRNVTFWQGNLSTILLYNRQLNSNETLQNFNALKSRFGL